MSFLLVAFSSEARQKPLIWDVDNLNQMKVSQTANSEIKNLLAAADKYIQSPPLLVTGMKKTYAPNEHYYCSMGPYWWPDTLQVGKYYNRDGIINPESKYYDSSKLVELASRCEILSKAFYLTEDQKYFNAFVVQLRAWFIDKDTYMYPNFEYSQVIPGQNGNKGRSTGMIDAYSFNSVIESIRLVDYVNRIDRRTYNALKKWFLSFAEWSDNHYGDIFQKVDNNISLAFDVTLVNIYLFAGKNRKAKRIADSFAERRIYKQILTDGSQPEELKRTNAYSYSIYNLTHIIDFCHIASYWDKDYYEKHKERIDKGFEFLQKYAEYPETFPYQQIKGMNSSKKQYNLQSQRRDALRKH